MSEISNYGYLENHVHINTIGVGPGMLEIFFQSLLQWIGDLVEFIKLSHSLHGRMISESKKVSPNNLFFL